MWLPTGPRISLEDRNCRCMWIGPWRPVTQSIANPREFWIPVATAAPVGLSTSHVPFPRSASNRRCAPGATKRLPARFETSPTADGGPTQPPQYRLVMLRRFNCVLEPSKDTVIREHARLTSG
jgi:hypothetical protein